MGPCPRLGPLFGDMASATYDMTPNVDGSWSYGWDTSVPLLPPRRGAACARSVRLVLLGSRLMWYLITTQGPENRSKTDERTLSARNERQSRW